MNLVGTIIRGDLGDALKNNVAKNRPHLDIEIVWSKAKDRFWILEFGEQKHSLRINFQTGIVDACKFILKAKTKIGTKVLTGRVIQA